MLRVVGGAALRVIGGGGRVRLGTCYWIRLPSPPLSAPTPPSHTDRQTGGPSLRGNSTTTTGKTNSHLPPLWKQQTVAERTDKERSGQGRWGTPSATVCCERTASSFGSTERQPVVGSGRTVTVARSSRAQGFAGTARGAHRWVINCSWRAVIKRGEKKV